MVLVYPDGIDAPKKFYNNKYIALFVLCCALRDLNGKTQRLF